MLFSASRHSSRGLPDCSSSRWSLVFRGQLISLWPRNAHPDAGHWAKQSKRSPIVSKGVSIPSGSVFESSRMWLSRSNEGISAGYHRRWQGQTRGGRLLCSFPRGHRSVREVGQDKVAFNLTPGMSGFIGSPTAEAMGHPSARTPAQDESCGSETTFYRCHTGRWFCHTIPTIRPRKSQLLADKGFISIGAADIIHSHSG